MSELALIAAQLALRYGPAFALQIVEICTKKDPTKEEVLAFFSSLKTNEDHIREANIRAGKDPNAPLIYVDDPPAQ